MPLVPALALSSCTSNDDSKSISDVALSLAYSGCVGVALAPGALCGVDVECV